MFRKTTVLAATFAALALGGVAAAALRWPSSRSSRGAPPLTARAG